MAVEARYVNVNPFAQRILGNRLVMVVDVWKVWETRALVQLRWRMVVTGQLSGTATEVYGGAFIEMFPKNTAAVRLGSSLPCADSSRKRSRQVADPPPVSLLETGVLNQSFVNRCGGLFTFLGEDLSFQFQQQQLEIDWFIAQHINEKVRMEIERRRKRCSRRIAAAMENVMKKLRAKQEEIEKMGKLNWQLEAIMKSLYEENQIWKDLAQLNEATANALRCNLEQLLAQVQGEHRRTAAAVDDTQSSCGSYSLEIPSTAKYTSNNNSLIESNRACRNCWQEESCMLLLSCQHLCLCTGCGSSLHTCPVCHCIKTASVHVNLSENDIAHSRNDSTNARILAK